MGKIRQLPPAVVNQIAAGEVIERPASVVKELLENSLDAEATRIEVTVEQGGRDLIRVWDNGSGIAAEDLPLAVAPHATSKLATADDLFRVATFGFRGEALASIASVSRVRVQSRPAGQQAGAAIEVAGSEPGDVIACGCPEGTAVEVRNLLYNTPVRRRFLKATQTEMAHIVEAFTRVALARPGLALVLRHNDKTLFDLPPSGQLLERLALFFGRELAEKLIWVESTVEGRRLWGYAAHPSESRSNPRTQYLFVNGRYVRDRSLSHALSEAYRGLLMVGRYPVAFLFFELPPEEVDVNVHPTKIEVRFREAQQQYSQLLATLRQRFLATDLTTRLEPAPAPANPETDDHAAGVRASLNDFLDRAQRGPAALRQPADTGRVEHDQAAARAGTLQLQPVPQPAGTPSLPFPPSPARPHPTPDETASRTSFGERPNRSLVETSAGAPAQQPGKSTTDDAPLTTHQPPLTSHQFAAMQVHDSYLVVETDDGLMVIDQHALHERVLYEELRRRVLGGSLESQRLLVPEMVELSAAEAAAVCVQREPLAQLGMTVEPFGGTTVALYTYPAMLANIPADRMLRDVVEQITSEAQAPDRRDLLDSLMHMIACKAAIKAGQRLTPDEIRSLVAQQHLAQDAHHCPHGRPTALVYSKQELERQFKRT